MANFTRRMLAFLLGIIFAFVLLVGGLVGGGYWAFKNLTLKSVGVKEDTLGGLTSLTFEEWVAFVMDVKKDPQGFTVRELEKKGLNVNSFLQLLKVDVDNADERDIESFRSLAIGSLFGTNGLYEVDMGVLFLFIPKNAETGKYPVFSEGARNHLRQYSLGDLMAKDSQNSGYSSIMRSMKLGSVLSSVFNETLDGGKYVYSAEDRGLNLIANIEMGMLTDMAEGEPIDMTHEVHDGYLASLGEKELIEIIASFGATTDDAYQQKYDSLGLFKGIMLDELFVYNEETGGSQVNLQPLLDVLTLGALLGVQLCTEDDECPVHDNVADCDGELYEGGVISEKPELEKAMLKNLASRNVLDVVMNGLDMSSILDGVYFGVAMGYTQCTGDEECSVHEGVDCVDSAGKWYGEDGEYVGKLFNDLADIELSDAMNGELDIEGIIEDCKIGEVFGYKKDGDVWYDKDGVEIVKETVTDKIMYQLYDKTINDFDTIDIQDLMGGITLGEFLKLTYDETDARWEDSEGNEASILYQTIAGLEITELMENPDALTDEIGKLYLGDFMEYEKSGDDWLDAGSNVVTGVDKTLADIKLSDVLNGTVNVDDALKTVQIGELLGYEFDGGVWKDNGTPVAKETMEDKIFYQLYDKTMEEFSDGSITMKELMDGIYLGEFLGLEKDGSTWVDKSTREPASVLYKTLADITIPELLDDGGAINKKLETLHLGDFMDFVLVGSTWCESDGVTPLTGVDKVLAEIGLDSILNGTVNINDSIKTVQIGELLGYEFEGGVWYDGNGNEIASDDITGKVFYGIYGKTVSEFGSLKIEDLMDGIYLGEFLGLKKEGSVWVDGDGNKPSVLYATLADITIPELLGDGNLITTKLSALYVGDFMGYVLKADGWYDKTGTTPLTGVDKMMAEICLGDVLDGTLSLDVNSLKLEDLIDPSGNKVLEFLCSGGTTIDGLKGKLDEMVLGDVVDTDGNTMLGLLADTKLDDLSTKINSLYLGEIMGFTRCTSDANCAVHGDCSTCTKDENCTIHGVDCTEDKIFWYEKIAGNWVLETGVEARVAELTVDSIDDHGIKELNFVLGDVLTHAQLEDSLFALAYTGVIYEEDGTTVKYKAVSDVSHIPVMQLADRIGVGAETASYLQLEDVGVVHLEDDVEGNLDLIFGTKVVGGVTIGVWEEWTINKIFTELVNKVTP
ncbi:MAG: hypothetical protein IJA97_05340 [Clostridia bacterium]|nr:hypothetical protein [Clostridia bacterium]